MKLTIEATTRISSSPLGTGRVWEGKTDQGTPVRVLVSGLAAGSDDPAVEAQFDREHDALPEPEGPRCPDCGEPMLYHAAAHDDDQGHEVRMTAKVELYEVIARWLIASDSGLVPPGVTEEGVAEYFRKNLERFDPDAHQRLTNAAKVIVLYIAEQLLVKATPQPDVVGHA